MKANQVNPALYFNELNLFQKYKSVGKGNCNFTSPFTCHSVNNVTIQVRIHVLYISKIKLCWWMCSSLQSTTGHLLPCYKL